MNKWICNVAKFLRAPVLVPLNIHESLLDLLHMHCQHIHTHMHTHTQLSTCTLTFRHTVDTCTLTLTHYTLSHNDMHTVTYCTLSHNDMHTVTHARSYRHMYTLSHNDIHTHTCIHTLFCKLCRLKSGLDWCTDHQQPQVYMYPTR